MTKKKPTKTAWGFGDPNHSVKEGVAVLERYLAQRQWKKAFDKFEELHKRHPENPELLEIGVNLFYTVEDWERHLEMSEKLALVSPDRHDVLILLGIAYIKNEYAFLALQVYYQLIEKFPDTDEAKEAKELLVELETVTNSLLEDLNLTTQDMGVAILHERSQLCMERGKYQQGIEVIQQILDIAPNFVPALNNLSLAYELQEQLEDAIATGKKALEIEPNNVKTLSNCVYFSMLSGAIEAAESYGEKLKAVPNELEEEVYEKKAEAFSYLRDDQAVIALGEEAEEQEYLDINPLFWHFVAVAYANQGDVKKARKYWQKALQELPDFSIIQENLDNIKLPLGERTSPWAFDLAHWINYATVKDLHKIAQELTEQKQSFLVQQFLEKYPRIIHLTPVFLDRGSPMTKEFIIQLISLYQEPRILEALKEFALGQRGSDQERLEAGHIANQAGLIPSGEVRMWMRGAWQDLLMIGMEISNEPPIKHSKKVRELLAQGILSLKVELGERAETFLKKALSLEPNAPDIQFNLSGAYQLQGRFEEALELVQRVHEEYPDYAFATIALARHLIQADDTEAAKQLLKPLLRRQHFHFDEFSKFCLAQIELAVATKNYDSAHSWLGMGERIDPDDPDLSDWRQRLEEVEP